MPPIDPEPNEEEKREKLEQDFDKPFSSPTPPSAQPVDPAVDHPATDHKPDEHEVYDIGAEGASGLAEAEDENSEPGERVA